MNSETKHNRKVYNPRRQEIGGRLWERHSVRSRWNDRKKR